MSEISVLLARALHPVVIVMDMAMPGLDGVRATREIVKCEPATAVLILSMYSGENYVRNALDAGARGHMLKEVAHAPQKADSGIGSAGKIEQVDCRTARSEREYGGRTSGEYMSELRMHRTAELIVWAAKKGLVHWP